MRALRLAFLIVLLTICTVQAEVVSLPLTELTGPYDGGGTSRATTVEIPLMKSIDAVWIAVRGDLVIGMQNCGGATLGLGIRFWVTLGVDQTDPLFWAELGSKSAGALALAREFSKVSTLSDYDVLREGMAVVRIDGFPWLVESCLLEITPVGTVTEVILMINGETAVPVESKSWGAIKALFRESAGAD